MKTLPSEARAVESEETRLHLEDAHHRVMETDSTSNPSKRGGSRWLRDGSLLDSNRLLHRSLRASAPGNPQEANTALRRGRAAAHGPTADRGRGRASGVDHHGRSN